MGLALIAVSTLARPFAALHHWWDAGRSPAAPQHPAPPPYPDASRSGLRFAAAAAPAITALPAPATAPRHRRASEGPTCAARSRADKPFPLRVLHPHGSGRMAIAGRMSEVCAELDRLVASEASH